MDCLIHYMNFPHLMELEHEGSMIPDTYQKHYTDSNIVRCRRGDFSYSILNQNPVFLYFQRGDLTMSLKIGASFCEHRAFQPQELQKTDNSYKLSQLMTGWYYLPFDKPQDTTDWWKMKNDSRNKIYGPDMNFEVIIHEVEGGIDVQIKVDGIDRAPLRIEMAFDSGTRIESDSFIAEGVCGGHIIAKHGMVTASKGNHAIQVGPAFGKHNFVSGKFGSSLTDPNCFTVYFTDFTCFDHTLSIRGKASDY